MHSQRYFFPYIFGRLRYIKNKVQCFFSTHHYYLSDLKHRLDWEVAISNAKIWYRKKRRSHTTYVDSTDLPAIMIEWDHLLVAVKNECVEYFSYNSFVNNSCDWLISLLMAVINSSSDLKSSIGRMYSVITNCNTKIQKDSNFKCWRQHWIIEISET